jgi:hypothetical protein
MIEAGEPSTGVLQHAFRGVRAPPGVGMVASLTILRNASRAKSKGRA